MDFNHHPSGVPHKIQNADKINEMVKTSWGIQKQVGVSNACMIVNLVLNRCLSTIGIPTTIMYGIVETENIKIPHVWLDIEGHVVDNTFVEDIPESVLRFKGKVFQYKPTIVSKEDGLFLGDHETQSLGINNHGIKQFQWGLSNPDKTLALSKNKVQLQWYFDTMSNFILVRHKVDIADFSELVTTHCWTCDSTDSDLKVCGNCKVAKYCSRECQRGDRKSHKQLCLPPNSY